MKPFSEDARFEQGNNNDPFYATGSIASIGETPGSFSANLSSKEQIRIAFAVKNKTQMLPNSSSLYYFNASTGQWNIPNSSLSDHVGPFGNVSIRTSLTNGSTFIEDGIGFDCLGNAVVSGSLPIQRNIYPNGYAQKIEDNLGYIGSTLSRDTQSEYMSRDFPKSIQRNSSYEASSSETFTIPVQDPFLIEKVVFELPICLGSGWFYDKTSLNFATSSGGDLTKNGGSVGGGVTEIFLVDQGGPGITLSLFCQKNYGTGSIRDLICHSMITHEEDTNREVILTPIMSGGYSPSPYKFLLWSLGRNGVDTDEVDCLVKPEKNGTKRFFTGSIQVKSEASISNGIYTFSADSIINPGSSQLISWINSKISQDYYKPYSTVLTGIDSFGRGMSGFSPSGGSIFGREYTTDQINLRKDGLQKNDLYISNESERQSTITALSSFANHTPNTTLSIAKSYFASSRPSPYLIYPGEKLVLAVSKTRPAFKNLKIDINTTTNPDAETKGIGTLLSSSYINSIPCTTSLNGHDVQLNTGSINITFYGSYVRAGNSYTP